jgi:hypothetical protein
MVSAGSRAITRGGPNFNPGTFWPSSVTAGTPLPKRGARPGVPEWPQFPDFMTKPGNGLVGLRSKTSLDSLDTQGELTITHELTHSLLEDRLNGFMRVTAYWEDEDTPTIETPPEGRASAAEDLRSSFGVFLKQQTGSRHWLRDDYPARYQFFANLYPNGIPAHQRTQALQNIHTHAAAFIHAVPFWHTANRASVEVPPTRRAWDSGAEDMAECVSLYMDPAGRLTLKHKCPLRYASVERILAQESRAAVQDRRQANAPSQAELNTRKLAGGRVLLPARIVGCRRIRQARR